MKLDSQPQNEQLSGDVTITARATQDLSSFNLDLRGFTVSSVTVNGSAANFTRKDQELTITPASGLRRNRDFTARVVYGGHVNNVRDPDHARDGWIPTEDGAFVVSEPQGTPSWMPVNDSLKDFATWDFQVDRPQGQDRDGERRARVADHQRRQDHVALARELADGLLPRDGHERLLRPAHRQPPERPAAVRRGRPADALLRREDPAA